MSEKLSTILVKYSIFTLRNEKVYKELNKQKTLEWFWFCIILRVPFWVFFFFLIPMVVFLRPCWDRCSKAFQGGHNMANLSIIDSPQKNKYFILWLYKSTSWRNSINRTYILDHHISISLYIYIFLIGHIYIYFFKIKIVDRSFI